MRRLALLALILLPFAAHAQTQQDYERAQQRQQQLQEQDRADQQQRQRQFDQNNRNAQQQQQFQQDLAQQKRLDALEAERQQQLIDNPPPVIVSPTYNNGTYGNGGYGVQPPAPPPGCRGTQPLYDANGRFLGDLCIK